jgi:hypothetical protein
VFYSYKKGELFASNTTVIFAESVGLGVPTPSRFFNCLSSDFVDAQLLVRIRARKKRYYKPNEYVAFNLNLVSILEFPKLGHLLPVLGQYSYCVVKDCLKSSAINFVFLGEHK